MASQSDSKFILMSDPSLRDGNHAIAHSLKPEQIAAYCRIAEQAGIPIVEVGHGNGIGASSLQLGLAAAPDHALLKAARDNLKRTQLGVHVIPGFATIERDLKPAMDAGVDVFRIASHCTEADITDRFLNYSRKQGKTTYGVLMMSHMASPDILLEEARKMESSGAEALVVMDSAGAYLPGDVSIRIGKLESRTCHPCWLPWSQQSQHGRGQFHRRRRSWRHHPGRQRPRLRRGRWQHSAGSIGGRFAQTRLPDWDRSLRRARSG